MGSYNSFQKNKLSVIQKILLFLFVFIYPILVSMYTMLPPLIGFVGYIIITNMSKNKFLALSAMFYLLNLDLNLTLPILLSTFVIVMIYIFLYSNLKLLIRCHVCLLFALMVLIDFSYYISLFIYDFMFNTSTVIGDMLLVYYIVIDIVIGLFL
jgi:hypothetical protein